MNFGLLPKYIARLGSWAGRWVRRQGCVGAEARMAGGRQARGRWQARGHGRTGRRAWRARQADYARGALAAGRGGRRGRARGRAGWALGSRPGHAGWPWAVHSVHSAYFWLGSTRYFPESKFSDIVREPGS